MSKRKLVLVGILFAISIGVLLLVREFVGEADGTVEPAMTKSTPAVTVGQRVTVNGTYANFSYPTKFITQSTEAVAAPVVERYNFRKQQVAPWQIAITITKLASGRLDDDGSYNYRDETPERFERDEQVHGGNQTVIFTDKTSDTFSRVAFIKNGSLAASIAISGGTAANLEQIEADFNAMIASWQWR